MTYEPPRDKTNKVAYAPSEDSDQPGHSPSLIRVFAVRMKKAWFLTTHWVHSEDSDQTESLLGAHVSLLVLSWGDSYEPHHEKTCLQGLRPGKTQTGMLSYTD